MKIIHTKDYDLIAKLAKHVHELLVDLYPKFFKPYNYEGFRDYFKGIIDNENFVFLVLEEKEQAVGYAFIELRNYPDSIFKKASKSVYVHQISINSTEKNKGYGSKLMGEMERIAMENEVNRIEMDYWVENEFAKKFYDRKGFTIYREFVYKEI